MTLGKFLLVCVFTHTLVRVPGRGIFKQNYGWPMGTNAATQWCNLIL